MDRYYYVDVTQTRTLKKVKVVAPNRTQAKQRALDLVDDGGMDEGLALPGTLGFKISAGLVKEGKPVD
jgi:hypothetical protein